VLVQSTKFEWFPLWLLCLNGSLVFHDYTLSPSTKRAFFFTPHKLPMAVARSSSDDNAIHCILPVLWIMSRFHIIALMQRMARLTTQEVSQHEATQRQSFNSTSAALSMLPPADWHPLASSFEVHNSVGCGVKQSVAPCLFIVCNTHMYFTYKIKMFHTLFFITYLP